MLAERYRDNATVIGADLHNEPHGPPAGAAATPARDWAAAATRAGNAVLGGEPEAADHRRGGGEPGHGRQHLVGRRAGRRRPDIRSRCRCPHRLVYSPHDYPASIFPQQWFAASGYPANLPARLGRRTGAISSSRASRPCCSASSAPRCETTSDRQWLASLVDYLKANQISFAYWSFNPNSGDTGGLVADDWVTPEQAKLDRPTADPRPADDGTGPPHLGPTPARHRVPARVQQPVPIERCPRPRRRQAGPQARCRRSGS